MNNIVAIVGRPNGKSTLLIGDAKREAIRFSIWVIEIETMVKRVERKEFSVIDTGGYVRGSDDVLPRP
jgi:predicted GTPase